MPVSEPINTDSKRELAKAQTRKGLLKSALKLYSQEGRKGLSMNKVAKGAGIAQPSFYNHFSSLDELLDELREQLKDNYMSPMRSAVVDMLKNFDQLNPEQFRQQNQACLEMIFNAAFQNILLFQRLLEDRPRVEAHKVQGLGQLVSELQQEWAELLLQGLEKAGRRSGQDYDPEYVYLSVDSAAAQVHEMILGCQDQRYSREQAILFLSHSLSDLFRKLF